MNQSAHEKVMFGCLFQPITERSKGNETNANVKSFQHSQVKNADLVYLYFLLNNPNGASPEANFPENLLGSKSYL